jgi:ribosomal protein L44E
MKISYDAEMGGNARRADRGTDGHKGFRRVVIPRGAGVQKKLAFRPAFRCRSGQNDAARQVVVEFEQQHPERRARGGDVVPAGRAVAGRLAERCRN